jgi:hypothetical protein
MSSKGITITTNPAILPSLLLDCSRRLFLILEYLASTCTFFRKETRRIMILAAIAFYIMVNNNNYYSS